MFARHSIPGLPAGRHQHSQGFAAFTSCNHDFLRDLHLALQVIAKATFGAAVQAGAINQAAEVIGVEVVTQFT